MTGRSDRQNLHRILEALGGDEMARVRFGDDGGEIFDVENPVSKALAWFEQLFSGMRDAGDEEAAKQGWAMLHILTISLAYGTNVTADIRHREPRSIGGKKGKKYRWHHPDAEKAVRTMLSKNPNAKIASLARAARGASGDLTVTEPTLRQFAGRIKGN